MATTRWARESVSTTGQYYLLLLLLTTTGGAIHSLLPLTTTPHYYPSLLPLTTTPHYHPSLPPLTTTPHYTPCHYQRSDPRQLTRLDGHAPKRGIFDQAPGADGAPAAQLNSRQQNSRLANRDSVGADNLLQPDSEGGAATQGGARAMGAVRQDNLEP